MIDQLARALEQMIYHQRLATHRPDMIGYHLAEVVRYRLIAYKLEKQLKITRMYIKNWVNLN